MSAGTLSRRTMLGRTFMASARTWAHLEWTIAELKRLHPHAYIVVYQTCYNVGVAASAGTHDKDGVFDLRIVGLGWWDAQLFLRRCGWAAWFRHTGIWEDESAWHIHMCSIPEGLNNTPTLDDIRGAYARLGIEVGEFVPGQIDDYFAHALGLAGQHRAGADTSRFPRDIAATIYRYQEDDLMAFSDWSDAEKKAFGQFIQSQVRATLLPDVPQPDGSTTDERLGSLLRRLAGTVYGLKNKIGA